MSFGNHLYHLCGTNRLIALWLLFVIMKFEVVGFNHHLISASPNQIYPSALTFACEAYCDILPYFRRILYNNNDTASTSGDPKLINFYRLYHCFIAIGFLCC